MNNSYLAKHAVLGPIIPDHIPCTAGIIITIPSYNEERLLDTLNSLLNCDRPSCEVEVLILLNASADGSDQVKQFHMSQQMNIIKWAATHSTQDLRFYIHCHNELPPNLAGVGLARKILMDESVRRFDNSGEDQKIIVTLDADTLVEQNYLTSIHKNFKANPGFDAANIYFEHALEGADYETSIYESIALYELHLRYYKQGISYSTHPFFYHSVGSALAVRNESYQKFGGMNTRTAGEDFYFFQKVALNGSVFDITDTCVHPSPRTSDRVPFGTGKAVQDLIDGKDQHTYTYHPSLFTELLGLFQVIPSFYSDPILWTKYVNKVSLPFLNSNNFETKIREIAENTSSLITFRRRFFQWFDALMALQFAHYYRDNVKPNISVPLAAASFLRDRKIHGVADNVNDLLKVYRALDKGSIKYSQ